MILQAYIDESYDAGGTFVLGGCIASAESWAAFSADWERLLLSRGLVNKRGQRYFKMSEMLVSPERRGSVPLFFRAIEDHVLGFLSVKLNTHELKRAKSRVVLKNGTIDNWGQYDDPYFMAYRGLLDGFHDHRRMLKESVLSPEQKVDFYFDENTRKKPILASWDAYIEERPPKIRNCYGATPRFEDDIDFYPLQAADFWVWWLRTWYNAGVAREKIGSMDFGFFKRSTNRIIFSFDILLGEDDLVQALKNMVRGKNGEIPIFDERTS